MMASSSYLVRHDWTKSELLPWYDHVSNNIGGVPRALA